MAILGNDLILGDDLRTLSNALRESKKERLGNELENSLTRSVKLKVLT